MEEICNNLDVVEKWFDELQSPDLPEIKNLIAAYRITQNIRNHCENILEKDVLEVLEKKANSSKILKAFNEAFLVLSDNDNAGLSEGVFAYYKAIFLENSWDNNQLKIISKIISQQVSYHKIPLDTKLVLHAVDLAANSNKNADIETKQTLGNIILLYLSKTEEIFPDIILAIDSAFKFSTQTEDKLNYTEILLSLAIKDIISSDGLLFIASNLADDRITNLAINILEYAANSGFEISDAEFEQFANQFLISSVELKEKSTFYNRELNKIQSKILEKIDKKFDNADYKPTTALLSYFVQQFLIVEDTESIKELKYIDKILTNIDQCNDDPIGVEVVVKLFKFIDGFDGTEVKQHVLNVLARVITYDGIILSEQQLMQLKNLSKHEFLAISLYKVIAAHSANNGKLNNDLIDKIISSKHFELDSNNSFVDLIEQQIILSEAKYNDECYRASGFIIDYMADMLLTSGKKALGAVHNMTCKSILRTNGAELSDRSVAILEQEDLLDRFNEHREATKIYLSKLTRLAIVSGGVTWNNIANFYKITTSDHYYVLEALYNIVEITISNGQLSEKDSISLELIANILNHPNVDGDNFGNLLFAISKEFTAYSQKIYFIIIGLTNILSEKSLIGVIKTAKELLSSSYNYDDKFLIWLQENAFESSSNEVIELFTDFMMEFINQGGEYYLSIVKLEKIIYGNNFFIQKMIFDLYKSLGVTQQLSDDVVNLFLSLLVDEMDDIANNNIPAPKFAWDLIEILQNICLNSDLATQVKSYQLILENKFIKDMDSEEARLQIKQELEIFNNTLSIKIIHDTSLKKRFSTSAMMLLQHGWKIKTLLSMLASIDKGADSLLQVFELLSDKSVGEYSRSRDGHMHDLILDLLDKDASLWSETAQNYILDYKKIHFGGIKSFYQLEKEILSTNRNNPSVIKLFSEKEDGSFSEIRETLHDITHKFRSRSDILENEEKPINQWSEVEISAWATKIKEFGDNSEEIVNTNLAEVFAVIKKGLRLTEGYNPRTIQLISILSLYKAGTGRLAEIATGEGKSSIVAMFGVVFALSGKKVDIITSNEVLATRDSQDQAKFFNLFGFTVAHNIQNSGVGPQDIYNRDIVYGTSNSFSGDVLRHEYLEQNQRGDRKFAVVLVDEVDSMFIDQGRTITMLSSYIQGFAELDILFMEIWTHLLLIDHGFVRDKDGKIIIENGEFEWAAFDDSILNEDGKSIQKDTRIRKPENERIDFIKSMLQSHMNIFVLLEGKEITKNGQGLSIPVHLLEYAKGQVELWVDSAVGALYGFVLDGHYVIATHGGYRVIGTVDDSGTGVVNLNMNWSHGLHQFLQLKNNIRLTHDSIVTSFMSVMSLIKRYGSNIYGMTGTLGGDQEKELLKEVYNVDFIHIPTYKSKQLTEYPIEIVNDGEFNQTILDKILDQVKKGRGVLVINPTIAKAKEVQRFLDAYIKKSEEHTKHITSITVYARNDYLDEEKKVKEIKAGEVIIATNLAGRGTNLNARSIESNGGLHVLLTFLPINERVKDQAECRTSRQGNSGTAQIIVSKTEAWLKFGLNEPDAITLISKRDTRAKALLTDDLYRYVPMMQYKDELFNKFKDFVVSFRKSFAGPTDKDGNRQCNTILNILGEEIKRSEKIKCIPPSEESKATQEYNQELQCQVRSERTECFATIQQAEQMNEKWGMWLETIQKEIDYKVPNNERIKNRDDYIEYLKNKNIAVKEIVDAKFEQFLAKLRAVVEKKEQEQKTWEDLLSKMQKGKGITTSVIEIMRNEDDPKQADDDFIENFHYLRQICLNDNNINYCNRAIHLATEEYSSSSYLARGVVRSMTDCESNHCMQEIYNDIAKAYIGIDQYEIKRIDKQIELLMKFGIAQRPQEPIDEDSNDIEEVIKSERNATKKQLESELVAKIVNKKKMLYLLAKNYRMGMDVIENLGESGLRFKKHLNLEDLWNKEHNRAIDHLRKLQEMTANSNIVQDNSESDISHDDERVIRNLSQNITDTSDEPKKESVKSSVNTGRVLGELFFDEPYNAYQQDDNSDLIIEEDEKFDPSTMELSAEFLAFELEAYEIEQDWTDTFFVAILGVFQIVIGFAITMATGGFGAMAFGPIMGTAIFAQGIGDMISAIVSVGSHRAINFDHYMKGKGQSYVISFLTAVILTGVQAIKEVYAAKEAANSAKAAAINVGSNVGEQSVKKVVELSYGQTFIYQATYQVIAQSAVRVVSYAVTELMYEQLEDHEEEIKENAKQKLLRMLQGEAASDMEKIFIAQASGNGQAYNELMNSIRTAFEAVRTRGIWNNVVFKAGVNSAQCMARGSSSKSASTTAASSGDLLALAIGIGVNVAQATDNLQEVLDGFDEMIGIISASIHRIASNLVSKDNEVVWLKTGFSSLTFSGTTTTIFTVDKIQLIITSLQENGFIQINDAKQSKILCPKPNDWEATTVPGSSQTWQQAFNAIMINGKTINNALGSEVSGVSTSQLISGVIATIIAALNRDYNAAAINLADRESKGMTHRLMQVIKHGVVAPIAEIFTDVSMFAAHKPIVAGVNAAFKTITGIDLNPESLKDEEEKAKQKKEERIRKLKEERAQEKRKLEADQAKSPPPPGGGNGNGAGSGDTSPNNRGRKVYDEPIGPLQLSEKNRLAIAKQEHENLQAFIEQFDCNTERPDHFWNIKSQNQGHILTKYVVKNGILYLKEEFSIYFPETYSDLAELKDSMGNYIVNIAKKADRSLTNLFGDGYIGSKKSVGLFLDGFHKHVPELYQDIITFLTVEVAAAGALKVTGAIATKLPGISRLSRAVIDREAAIVRTDIPPGQQAVAIPHVSSVSPEVKLPLSATTQPVFHNLPDTLIPSKMGVNSASVTSADIDLDFPAIKPVLGGDAPGEILPTGTASAGSISKAARDLDVEVDMGDLGKVASQSDREDLLIDTIKDSYGTDRLCFKKIDVVDLSRLSDEAIAKVFAKLPSDIPEGRLDYSLFFRYDLENFVPEKMKLFHGKVVDDLWFANVYDKDRPLGFGSKERTLSWGTHFEVTKRFPSTEDMLQRLAIVYPDWGERNTLGLFKIPKGTEVTFVYGKAAPKESVITGNKFQGKGFQMRFRDFDEKWLDRNIDLDEYFKNKGKK